MRPAGKAAHAGGDLPGFRRMAGRLAALLGRAEATAAPFVAFEPAFGIMLRQEYAGAGIAVPRVRMIQEFLLDDFATPPVPQMRTARNVTLLTHCIEATMSPQSADLWRHVFEAIGIAAETPVTGCCGMAGLFGYQKRHQQMSRTLFDLSWRRQLEGKAQVAATGFSCRCQSGRFSTHGARHPLGIIADCLASDG